MHEANFTREIVEAVIRHLEQYPNRNVSSVRVRVGEMLHLMLDSVKLHYQLQAKGTALERVSLEFVELPVRIACRSCKREGGVEDHHMLMCSYCESRDVALLSGNEILIDDIKWHQIQGVFNA